MSTNGNASVSFKVADNGVSSFMDNIKRKSDSMTNDMIRQAQEQTKSGKEQTAIIQEQIKLLERKASIEKIGALEQAKISRDNRVQRLDDYKSREIASIWKDARDKKITNKEAFESSSAVVERVNESKDRVERNFEDKVNAVNASYKETVLTNQLLRQNIDTAKSSSREQLNQMRKGDIAIVNAVDETALPMDRFVNQVASQKFEEEKEKEKKENKGRGDKEQWLSFTKALAFDRGLGLAANIPAAKNELDFIKPITSILGMLTGGIAGNLIDMANVKIFGNGLGNTNFGGLGTQLGEKAGEFFGTAIERSWKSRDELTSNNYRIQALTGQNLGIEKFKAGENTRGLTAEQAKTYDFNKSEPQGSERYGIDLGQEAELMYQVAQRMGYGRDMRGNAENVMAAQQGIGVSKETSFALMELQRSSKEGDKDFLRTLGGILQEGQKGIFKEDRAFFNEFVSRNFISLQRELLKTNNRVASGTSMDILQKFNSMGDQFSARDPRSLNLISQINNAISHPGSDNMKALSFSVMKQLHPEMNGFDIQREVQHGMNSPKYLQSMMRSIGNISGGSEEMFKRNIAGAFGLQDNLDAVETLFQNRDKIMKGQFSMKTLAGTGEFDQEAIRKQGQEQTSYYTQSAAQIQNKFVGDVSTAIDFVGTKMKDLFGTMLTGLQDYILDKMKGNEGPPPTNTVMNASPNNVRSKNATPIYRPSSTPGVNYNWNNQSH